MFLFFFFNDTATTEIYTLSLHDALPISLARPSGGDLAGWSGRGPGRAGEPLDVLAERPVVKDIEDRKSTRLNSSHPSISYAVFCLKKKKKKHQINKKDTKNNTITNQTAT